VALTLDPNQWVKHMSVKISPGNINETIKTIDKVWKKFSNGYPFEYYFLDEAYDNMYKSEIKLNAIFKYFAVLAVFISCLGLFGMASFTAEQSRKEIGIRKALGASVQDIFNLLSWKFIKWVIVANLIALPAGYYFTNRWLQNFAFRIDPGIAMFMYAVFLTMLIASCTIGFQTLKAAFANPVNSLRYE
ncbi:ABC transporter permease, partial [candidate division KSB1 bacterium]